MPIKIAGKRYKKFSTFAASIKKKKGFSKKRANAYAAAVARKTGQLHTRKSKKKKK